MVSPRRQRADHCPDSDRADCRSGVREMYQHTAIMSNHASEASYQPSIGPIASERQREADNATQAYLCRLHSVVAELFKALSESLHNEPGNAVECLRRAEAMLDGRHQQAARASVTTARSGLAPWQVRRVLAHIDANLATSVKNKDLAAIAGLSLFHFNFAFRNSVGDSPHEYIIRRRMERAQGLMLSSELSLSEIAAECGLADQSHFTRLFHRFAGDSPGAWRRARANPRP
jgi:AraC family transcriptional regulator